MKSRSEQWLGRWCVCIESTCIQDPTLCGGCATQARCVSASLQHTQPCVLILWLYLGCEWQGDWVFHSSCFYQRVWCMFLSGGQYIFFYFFKFYLFIYLVLAVLGLHFCARALSNCGKWGPLFIAVCGPLTIAASPAAEHRLQTRRLSSCGSRAQLLHGMWDPPRPGLEPVSPALAGRFSTTAPPGKPSIFS